VPPRQPKKYSTDEPLDLSYAGFNSRLVKALSHPLRARSLAILNERTASPKEIHEQLDVPLGNVTYHVKVLGELGCIELVKTTPRRGATEHYYRGTTRSFLNKENWSQLSPDAKSGVTVAGLKMINDASRAALEAETFDSQDSRHLSCTPVNLDQQGWDEIMVLLDETLDGILAIQGECVSRQAKVENAESIRATISLLGFESPPPGEPED
jgi:DNA-binding transcriptional ArsR family regulator